MNPSEHTTLYSLALSMLDSTSPYPYPPEELRYTYTADGRQETNDFCEMVRQYLSRKKYETGKASSHANNCRKCIETIGLAMIEYLDDYQSPYSVVQHHRNRFGRWLQNIVDQYGQGMEFELPKQLQYDNENQSTVVLLLKELQNREGVTKKDLQKKLCIKPRQVAKDLRKLDHSLIDESSEPADMSDYVPFRIGGQPVQVKISAERNPYDRTLHFKTVNSLHPIILQENLMQAGTLIQALCRNYYEHDHAISLYIATDIWYQLSEYARSRIRWVFAEDADILDFIDVIENDFPAENETRYISERDMLWKWDLSFEEMLTILPKAPGRRCDITLRDTSGNERKLYDQSISILENTEDGTIYTAIGRDGNTVNFSISEISAIDECSK